MTAAASECCLSLFHQNSAAVLGILQAKQQVWGVYQAFAERIGFY